MNLACIWKCCSIIFPLESVFVQLCSIAVNAADVGQASAAAEGANTIIITVGPGRLAVSFRVDAVVVVAAKYSSCLRWTLTVYSNLCWLPLLLFETMQQPRLGDVVVIVECIVKEVCNRQGIQRGLVVLTDQH